MTIHPFQLPKAAVLALAVAAAGLIQQQSLHAAECSGDFGTEVDFVDTPAEAAKLALKQEKLVFVLHVSGDFEDPRFT